MPKISATISSDKFSGRSKFRLDVSTTPTSTKSKRRKVEVAEGRWEQLPTEMQLAVLLACDFHPLELTRLRLVSKSFSRLIDDPSLWRNFCPPEVKERKGNNTRAKMGGAAFRKRVTGLSAPMQRSLRRIWDGHPRCAWETPLASWDDSCEHSRQHTGAYKSVSPTQQVHGIRANLKEIQSNYDLYLAAIGHPEYIGYSDPEVCFDEADPNLLRQYIRTKPGEILSKLPHLFAQIPLSSLYQEVEAYGKNYFSLLTSMAKTRSEKNVLRLCKVLIDLKKGFWDSRYHAMATRAPGSAVYPLKPFDPTIHPLYNAILDNFTSRRFYRRLYDLDARFYFWYPNHIALSSLEKNCLISEHPADYRLSPKSFFSDINLAHIAACKISENIFLVSSEVLRRPDFAKAMLKFWAEKKELKDIRNILVGIDASFRSDFEAAFIVLSRHGTLLKYFDENIKNSFGSVSLAVRSNNAAFLFAGSKLTADIQSVGNLASINPFILPDVQDSLRFRPEVRCSAATAFLKLMRPHLAQKLFQDALDSLPDYREAQVGIKLASYLIGQVASPSYDLVSDEAWYDLINL